MKLLRLLSTNGSSTKQSGSKGLRAATLCLGIALAGSASLTALAQQGQSSNDERAAMDVQTESNVVTALESSSALKGQQVIATTVNGDVTLTGQVNDPASKELAETIADRVSGVRSVVNNLTIANAPAATQSQAQDPSQGQGQAEVQNADEGPDPAAQNLAPTDPNQAPNQAQNQQYPDQQYPGQQNQQAQAQQPPMPGSPQDPGQPQAQSNAPYPYPSGPAPRSDDQNQANGDQGYGNGGGNGYPQSNGVPQYGNQGNSYPQGSQAPPRRPYSSGGYNSGGGYNAPVDPRQYAIQNSGPVTLPTSTILRVRNVETLDARKLQPGQVVQLTAANDVFVGSSLAVPRGAALEAVVTDVKGSTSGSLTGGSSLALRLTNLNLEDRNYALNTDVWTAQGPGKGAYSANNTIGGAAVGAIIGGIIGRGPGAAVGAVAGGATGAAASSASSGPRMVLPPESILTFHLTQPITVKPVSYQEAQRLGALNQGPPTLRQRAYYPPPSPPYYYGPRYYPYGW